MMPMPSAQRRGHRDGFSLVEALVVLAVLAILMGLLMPSVQNVREAANCAQCRNNLKQLALAVQNFHDTRGHMPVYFGLDPAVLDPNIKVTFGRPEYFMSEYGILATGQPGPGQVFGHTYFPGTTDPNAQLDRIAGGWFVHVLPYVEQAALYESICQNIVNANAPGVPQIPPCNWWVGFPAPAGVGDGGGKIPNGQEYVPLPPVSWTVWQQPLFVYNFGIFKQGVSNQIFSVLICPSDPSAPSDYIGEAKLDVVWQEPFCGVAPWGWGGTNYLANWNVFGNSTSDGSCVLGPSSMPIQGNPAIGGAGWLIPQNRFRNILDGLSNSILFAEGYMQCGPGYFRRALNPPNKHNFGLTTHLDNYVFQTPGYVPVGVSFWEPYGLPNTLMFQVQPDLDKCDAWKAQTPHKMMHVAMADGSVCSVSPAISQLTWNYAMLPRDGQVLGSDWENY